MVGGLGARPQHQPADGVGVDGAGHDDPRGRQLLHRGRVGGDEDVNRCPVLDLRGERLGRPIGGHHRNAGLFQEGGQQCLGEHFLQVGGSGHAQRVGMDGACEGSHQEKGKKSKSNAQGEPLWT